MEGIAARNTRARVEHRPRAGQLNPLLVARFAVLAKASSLAGAIFAGAYGGVAVLGAVRAGHACAWPTRTSPPSIAGLVGGLALVAAALLLERACRVPGPPDDSDDRRRHRRHAR